MTPELADAQAPIILAPKESRNGVNSEAGPTTTKKPRVSKPSAQVMPKAKTTSSVTKVRVSTTKVKESKASPSSKLSWKVVKPHVPNNKNVKVKASKESPGIRPRLWSASREELTSTFVEISGAKCVNNVSWTMTDMPIVILDNDFIQLQQPGSLTDDLFVDMIIARDFILPSSNIELDEQSDTTVTPLEGLPAPLLTLDPLPSTSMEDIKVEPKPPQATFGASSFDSRQLVVSNEGSRDINGTEHQSGLPKLFIKIPTRDSSISEVKSTISPHDGSKCATLEDRVGQRIISKPRRSPRDTGLPNNLHFNKRRPAPSIATESPVKILVDKIQSLVPDRTAHIPDVQATSVSSVLPNCHDQPPFMRLPLGTDVEEPAPRNTVPKDNFPPLRLDAVANHAPPQPRHLHPKVFGSADTYLPHIAQQPTTNSEIASGIPGLMKSFSASPSLITYNQSSIGKPVANTTRRGTSAVQLSSESTMTPYLYQLKSSELVKSTPSPFKSENSTTRQDTDKDKENGETSGSCNDTTPRQDIDIIMNGMNGEEVTLDLGQTSAISMITELGDLTAQVQGNISLVEINGPGDVLPPVLAERERGAKEEKAKAVNVDAGSSISVSQESGSVVPKKRGRPPKKPKVDLEPSQPQPSVLPEIEMSKAKTKGADVNASVGVRGSQELAAPKKQGRPRKKAKIDPEQSLPEPGLSKSQAQITVVDAVNASTSTTGSQEAAARPKKRVRLPRKAKLEPTDTPSQSLTLLEPEALKLQISVVDVGGVSGPQEIDTATKKPGRPLKKAKLDPGPSLPEPGVSDTQITVGASVSAGGSQELAAPKKYGRLLRKAKLEPEPIQSHSSSLPEPYVSKTQIKVIDASAGIGTGDSQETIVPKKRNRPLKKTKLDLEPVQLQPPLLPEPEVSKGQITSNGIPTPLPLELQVLIDAYINGIPVAMFVDKNRLKKYWGVQVASEVQYAFMGLYRVHCVVESLGSGGSEGISITVKSGKGRVQWRFRLKWETGGEDWSADDDDTMDRLSAPWWNSALGSSIASENEKQIEDEISTLSYRTARKEKELVDGYHPFRYLYYSVLPIQLMAPVDAEIPDSSFSRGWYCMDCGKLNFRFFLRHTGCESSFCKSKPYIPGYAIDIDDLRDPHDTLSLTLPMDEYPNCIEMKAQNWTDKMQTSVYTLDQFRKVAITHIFTCNLRDLQNEATDLLNQIQKDVPLRRQVGDGNPYFIYYAGDKNEPFKPWKCGPRCLDDAKQLMLDRSRKYGKKASSEVDIDQLIIYAWVSQGSKRTSDLLCAKERCMVIMCLGCEVIMSISSKSIMNDDHIRMPDLDKLIKFEDRTPIVEDGIESSDVSGVGEGREMNKMEELSSAVSKAQKKVKSVEKNQNMPVSVTLVHGDILLLEGDDFEYTLKRTGTSIMLFGSCSK